MRVLAINSVIYGSTGTIMISILKKAHDSKADVLACYGVWKDSRKTSENKLYQFGFVTENYISAIFTRITGMHNIVTSLIGTLSLIKKINQFKPDIIHLHNLHLWVINLPILFSYIKKHNIPVVWTLHDCWAFTGQCPHFTMVKCNKWKTGCHDCPQYRQYPASYVDRTKTMWKLKKKGFTGIQNMTIVTPSQWLAHLVSQSFLKDYPVKVINNGIDLNIFKPTPSSFREKHGLMDKYLVLGVAFGWGKRKGLDVFIDLSKRLDNEKYRIILVGTDNEVDKQLPDNILSIHRTQNQTELAEIYTVADLFANPTREENFPTVNMEALACGTPVLTFRTGGSPEIINENTGCIVDCDDIEAMKQEIIHICEDKPYSTEACLNRARSFDMNDKFGEYMKLYLEICGESNGK